MKVKTKVLAAIVLCSICLNKSFAQDKNTVSFAAADANAKSDAEFETKAGHGQVP